MTDNYLDVDFFPRGAGWVICVTYWYYNRSKVKRKISSQTTYTWYTECKELVDLFHKKRTKIFYSQIRVLARTYGKKEREIF